MKRVLFALALLATPAFAADSPKPITITATLDELNALDQLIDAGVRAQGLSVAENALFWHKKLIQAVTDSAKPEPTESPKP